MPIWIAGAKIAWYDVTLAHATAVRSRKDCFRRDYCNVDTRRECKLDLLASGHIQKLKRVHFT